MDILSDHNLEPLNTLAVPSSAACFVRVADEAELVSALRIAHAERLPLLVLGGGSNVVLPERFAGLVVQVGMQGIEVVAEDDTQAWVRAGAGVVWQELVEYSLRRNLHGLENLSLIPGTVGAAPIQNIGAYGVELDTVFETLGAVHRETFETRTFTATDCEFRYRDSVFKNRLRDQFVITSVTVRLRKRAPLHIAYVPLADALAGIPGEALTPRAVSDAVIAIRRSKLPDPAEVPNAGSFFKNPIVSEAQFERLQQACPGIVSYPLAEGGVKLAAGWLLEKAGWRGHAQGGIGMHAKQALVLVNPGHRPGEELLRYARRIQADIAERFGVVLEREPVAYTG